MPLTWIRCVLTVEGDIASFVKAAAGYDRQYVADEAEKQSLVRLYQKRTVPPRFDELSFHALYPVPDEILRSGYKVGYDWEVVNWGCKWGATRIKRTCPMSNMVRYRFNTPDNAPLALLDKVASDYPTLKLVLKFNGVTITWEHGKRG